MGSLKPGVTYVYERDRGLVYAREMGAAPETRKCIGGDYKAWQSVQGPTGNTELDDHNEWIRIRLAGKDNPALQKAIDNVKLIYKIIKEESQYGRES